MYKAQDPTYTKGAANTYASKLRGDFKQAIKETTDAVQDSVEDSTDVLALVKRQAVQALRSNQAMVDQIYNDGVLWGAIQSFLIRQLPRTLKDGGQIIYDNMPEILTQVFGQRGPEGWDTRKNNDGKSVVYANRRG